MSERKRVTFSEDVSDGKETPDGSMPAGTPRMARARSFDSWEVGDDYKISRPLGSGSYGQVCEATKLSTGERVAIKRIPNVFDHTVDAKRLLREVFILRKVSDHPNIITLLDILLPSSYEDFNDLYLVFEFVDTDAYRLILSSQWLQTAHVRVFLYRILTGLHYLHKMNVIHRDIKPANILLNEDCSVRICDFGLARVVGGGAAAGGSGSGEDGGGKTGEPAKRRPSVGADETGVVSGPPKAITRQLTKHVVTRWYRAPELILLQDYDASLDMWSVGCILGELLGMMKESCPDVLDRAPLFPGRSCFPLSADSKMTYTDRLDQLNVVFSVIGTPSEEDIAGLGEVSGYLRRLEPVEPRGFASIYPGAPDDALDLLEKMLTFNPAKRITVAEALEHRFLRSVRKPEEEILPTEPIVMPFDETELDKAALKSLVYEEILTYHPDAPDLRPYK